MIKEKDSSAIALRDVGLFQGLSLAHDVTGAFLSNTFGSTVNSIAFNFQTMPVVYGLNAAGSLINDSPGMIGFYSEYRENN